MDLIKTDIYKKLFLAIKEITSDTQVAIFHDLDPDGLTSCAILDRALFRIRGRRSDLHIHQERGGVTISQNTISTLQKKNIGVLFCLDRAVDQDPETVKSCEKICKLIVIDHHQYTNDIASERCLFIKPDKFSEVDSSKYPTARMVYDLFFTMADLDDCDWLMAVGVIGDAAYKQWKFAIDGVFDRYRITKKADVYETKLAQVTKVITSTVIVEPKDIPKLCDFLYGAKEFTDVMKSHFKTHEEAFDKEITNWFGLVEKKGEVYPEQKTVIYYITPKYGIRSVLSTLLSIKKFNNWTMVIAEEMLDEKLLGISIRNQSGEVDCVELVHHCIEGLEGANGGGHKPAVGGRIRKKDWKIFHTRLMERMGISQDAYEESLKKKHTVGNK